MSFSATIPVEEMDAANAALEAAGFGPGNFSVPIYGAGAIASHAGLHSWDIPGFRDAVAQIANVEITDGVATEVTFPGHVASRNLGWGGDAPLLAGQVTPGLYHDEDNTLWWVLQPFDRSVFTEPLDTYPALVRRARVPGEVTPWVRPIDAADAYAKVNSFTGQPDRVTHNGGTWDSDVDVNVWEPGFSGWVLVEEASAA